MDASRWDSGSVPTAGTTAIIPSGRVTIRLGEHAEAKHVHVESGARLNVYAKGSLSIIGSNKEIASLLNEGRTYVWGDLVVANTSNDVPTIVSGIRTTDYFFVGVNGEVTVQDVNSGYGLLNSTSGSVLNRGLITMTQVDFDNIRNLNEFDNEGDIELHDINVNGILNKGEFTSDASSLISLMDGNIGILKYPNASIENHGLIDIVDTNYGVTNKGEFVNEASAELTITDGIQGITNRNISGAGNGDFIHHGSVIIYGCITAIRNEDYLFNTGLILTGYYNSVALKNISGSFVNDGSAHLTGYNKSIVNETNLFNEDNGYLLVNNVIENKTVNAYFENLAFLSSSGSTQHTLDASATLINFGVVEDDWNTFSGTGFDNQQVYVSRVYETLEDGEVYHDLIEVVDASNLDIQDWYEQVPFSDPIVGTFDVALNEFTANSNAEGLDLIKIDTYILSSGIGRSVGLHVEPPTSARVIGSTENDSLSPRGSEEEKSISVYPSLVTSEFNIDMNGEADNPFSYHIYDSVGQCLFSGHSDSSLGLINVEVPESAPQGMLYVVLRQEDKVLTTEKIFRKK